VADGGRVLTRAELHRALLARQLLLDRAVVTVPRALELMGTLQAQYAPSMYVGLWSRVQDFRRAELTGALESRTAVQGTLQRITIHLVSAADYWPVALAVRSARRRHWLRAIRGAHPAEAFEEAAATLRRRLAAGPMRRSEIEQLVGRDLVVGVGLWVDLVRVPPSGTWERRRADLYGLAEDWLGPPAVPAQAATGHLVHRYLGGFGPSTAAEVADWAGLPVAEVAAVLDRPGLRRFRAEDGAQLFDLPGAPLPDPATPAPARFLGTWDAILLAHARRKGVLGEEHRALIFSTKTPHSFPTFLVDGKVAGAWRHERGRVHLEPFGPLSRRSERELEAEAARLADLHA
jgi:hypothetical protein